MPFHPEYGLPAQYHIRALKFSLAHGVPAAARLFNVSTSSIYRWRRSYTVAQVLA